ncbi:MAG: hypothetical protein GXY55_21805 [Phycisphaerae bacterium]|nr:hypothetical protein [Phycisphaerae bacterium]
MSGSAWGIRITAVLLLVVCADALAENTYWQGSVEEFADWNDPTCWSGGVPQADWDAGINNGGQAEIAGIDVNIGHLYLGNDDGESGTVALNGSSSSLTALDQYIGYSGTGLFTQNGGMNTIAYPGANTTAGELTLGYWWPSQGTYEMKGGELTVHYRICAGLYGRGIFIHRGGKVSTTYDSGAVRLGYLTNSEGTYELSGDGELATVLLTAGKGGKGKFIQTGGTCTVEDTVYVGRSTDDGGAYELSGAGVLTAGSICVGYRDGSSGASGSFVQTGGTATVGGLQIGEECFSGSYRIQGGRLAVSSMSVGCETGECSGSFDILDPSAEITISQFLALGSKCTFSAVAGSTIRMAGAGLFNESHDAANLGGLANVTLVFEGGTESDSWLEVAGQDMGAVADGLLDNFAVDTVRLGGEAGIGKVQLRNYHDNQRDWTGVEALYVENLILGAGSLLDLNGFSLYYVNLIDYGGDIQYNGGALIPLPEPAALLLLAAGGLAALRRRG